jgi:sugar phosphate isomerase/epimerase
MGTHHPIAMASGIMPEATPVQLIEAAALGGFDYCGMWFEPETRTLQTTRDVRRAMESSGMRLLDIEVVWLKPGPPDPHHARLIEVGAELGAPIVLCVSSDPDMSAARDKLAALMTLGEALNIRVNLEFGLFTEVKTLNAARSIVESIGSPAGGVLVDSLHL